MPAALGRALISGNLIMQCNKVHHVSEALVQDLTLGLEPEDGDIWMYGANLTTGCWPSPMKASRRLLLEEYHRVITVLREREARARAGGLPRKHGISEAAQYN
ncbi:hypothetical protein [Mesorhizobium sp. M0296]|uniref:hypothetical protein n=1 Tax=Mesorhizobium sp. M0296 TaxID=2956931 RepID=UPI003339CABA